MPLPYVKFIREGEGFGQEVIVFLSGKCIAGNCMKIKSLLI